MLGVDCFVHGLHSAAVPIDEHHVRPIARGGERAAPTVPLCANAHGLVHALLDEIEAMAVASPYATVHEVVRTLPDPVWAGFPGRVRLVAYRGWQLYGLAFLGRRFTKHHRLWDSAGRPRTPDTPAYGQTAAVFALPRRSRMRLRRL